VSVVETLKNGLSAGVEPSSFKRRMKPVRCASSGSGPTKLIIGNRPELVVLQQPTAAIVAHQNVQLAVWTKPQYAAVMISTQGLIGISLVSAQLDQVAIKCQRRAVPNVTIDAIRQRLKDISQIC